MDIIMGILMVNLLLAALLHYELTKIESITKELEEAQSQYNARVERLKEKKSDFKKEYKTQIEIYKKVVESKKEGLTGSISDESVYVKIKEEFDKFNEVEQALQKYKQETVNGLIEKKQHLLQLITDARRKRQVELNKQEHRKDKSKSLRTDLETQSPQPQVPGSPSNPEENPETTPGGSGVINVEVLAKELAREDQINRAQLLLDYYEGNRRVLETAHDDFETRLNDASSTYEGQLYSYHVARVQKWDTYFR